MKIWRCNIASILGVSVLVLGTFSTQGQTSNPPKKKHPQPINPNDTGGTRGEATEGDCWLIVSVKESGGVAISGADLTVTSPAGKVYKTTTDRSGRASLGGLAAAKYRIQITAVKYESKTVPVDLASKPATSVDIVLLPSVAK